MTIYTAPIYTKSILAKLEESEIQFPFSDEDATYDGLKHQYRLTREYFAERGRDLDEEIEGDNPDKINQFLDYLQLKIYTYIYTHNKSTRGQLNYLIAKRGIFGYSMFEYRQSFLEAMYLEGCYLLDNGDISAYSGVDFGAMQNMSIDVVRGQERDMHKTTIGILKSLGLNYYGNYRFVPQGKDW